ncbi:MAG: nucleoside monophosphate kinase [Patescibacteria group bacterium]
MNLLILGPQGSGKGTQAKILVEKFGFFYLESGEFLREIAVSNDVLKKMMDEGLFVPDNEMVSYITAFLDSKGIYGNILFDGFPRNIEQYKFLKNWLNDKQVVIDLVLVLKIDEEESVERLILRGREDDNLDSIKKRLSLYTQKTEILIQELKKEIKVVEVDGERSVEAISGDLIKIINDINQN